METLDEIRKDIGTAKKLLAADTTPPDAIVQLLARLRELEGKRDKLIAEQDAKAAHEQVTVSLALFGTTKKHEIVVSKRILFADFDQVFRDSAPEHVQNSHYWFTFDGSKIADDASLRAAIDKSQGVMRLSVEADQIPYSFMTLEILKKKGIIEEGDTSLEISMSEVKDIAGFDVEFARLLDDLRRRYLKFGDITKGNETTRREYISCVLLSAAMLFEKVTLKVEEATSGQLARGPLDYLFIYKNFHILVTEAKQNETNKGVAQNVAQLYSARDENRRKRKRDDYEDVWGIVTTGSDWTFIQLSKSGETYRRSRGWNLPVNDVGEGLKEAEPFASNLLRAIHFFLIHHQR
eukprot:m.197385 g.197385  ORF g.197385 m.197385 type:complete len:350 (-) comp10088_c0_seq29:207-1256(-)